MAEFTKGPWGFHAGMSNPEIREITMEEGYVFEAADLRISSGDVQIAEVNYYRNARGYPTASSYDEFKANAHLIAAAPELYEAVIALNSLIEKMQSAMVDYILPDSEKTNQDFIGEIIELLDGPIQREAQEGSIAALAKARGE